MKIIASRITLYIVLVPCLVVMLTPLVWLVAQSVKSPEDFFFYTFFPPVDRFSGYNFRKLFAQIPFLRFLMNSLFVSSATVVVQLFLSSLGGFAFAKYEFRGKRVIMVIMLATMMIPGQVLLAPLYELICRLGLMDSFLGLIIPSAVSTFGMFLFQQSMRHIAAHPE